MVEAREVLSFADEPAQIPLTVGPGLSILIATGRLRATSMPSYTTPNPPSADQSIHAIPVDHRADHVLRLHRGSEPGLGGLAPLE